MIKFKKRVEPPKQVKNQTENRFNQINEAASEKRNKTTSVPPKSVNSKDRSKVSE